MGELGPIIRACLSGEADSKEATLAATNRRGRHVQCRVVCTPLGSAAKKRDGVILMMDELG